MKQFHMILALHGKTKEERKAEIRHIIESYDLEKTSDEEALKLYDRDCKLVGSAYLTGANK